MAGKPRCLSSGRLAPAGKVVVSNSDSRKNSTVPENVTDTTCTENTSGCCGPDPKVVPVKNFRAVLFYHFSSRLVVTYSVDYSTTIRLVLLRASNSV